MSETETLEAGQFLGEDGVFQENWLETAFDEGDALRSNPTLANMKDIRTLARQVVNGESTIGKLSGGREFTILPNEQSTEKEKAEHFTKLGRPESAEGYEFDKLQLPESVPKDDAIATKMAQSLFKHGVSKPAAQGVFQDYTEMLAEIAKAVDTEDKLGNAEANKQLHTALGSAYDAKIASANVAIEALARPIDNDFAEMLKKEMPYDVHAAQMLAKIGELISEDPGLKAGTQATGLLTPGDARAKAKELQANPYYGSEQPVDKPRNAALHKQIIDEYSRLIDIANA